MLLSKLAYLAVKNAIYYADGNFIYESFVNGSFDNDIDYALNINNVFTPINEAISRLVDLDKIHHKIKKVSTSEDHYLVEFSSLKETSPVEIEAKEIIGVGDLHYRPIAFKQFGVKGVLLERPCDEVYVEFKQDIPSFSKAFIVPITANAEDNNIDLKEFGLTESMCQYIIEFAQGKLMRNIAPELGNMHVTIAETYFSNLKQTKPAFIQKKIETVYTFED